MPTGLALGAGAAGQVAPGGDEDVRRQHREADGDGPLGPLVVLGHAPAPGLLVQPPREDHRRRHLDAGVQPEPDEAHRPGGDAGGQGDDGLGHVPADGETVEPAAPCESRLRGIRRGGWQSRRSTLPPASVLRTGRPCDHRCPMADTRRPFSDVRGVLFDFYGTLARAVSWGETHEEVFARRGLEEAGGLWGSRWVGGVGRRRAPRTLGQPGRLPGMGTGALAVAGAGLRRRRRRAGGAGRRPLSGHQDVHPRRLPGGARRAGRAQARGDWWWRCARTGTGTSTWPSTRPVSPRPWTWRSPRPGPAPASPTARIFDHTLGRCGLEAGQALFAGDTWVPDVEGPLAAGMRPVHVWREDRADEPEPPPLVDGVVRAADLSTILRCVRHVAVWAWAAD